MTLLFTCQSVNDPTHHKVVARASWPIKLWLVDTVYDIYDLAPTTSSSGLPSLHVPLDEPTTSIDTLRQFPSDATDPLTDRTEARPLIRTELNVTTFDGRQLFFCLVECAATLYFVSHDFVRRLSLPTLKP
jgi:hypothetical protein